jgi:hypothetical protein
MRKSAIVALAATMTVSAIASAQQTIYSGSEAAIRAVISGHTCKGKDILRFGAITPGTAGRFERAGSPIADYTVGYGTILIRRGGELHGHVTSVSVHDQMLYLSADRYQC